MATKKVKPNVVAIPEIAIPEPDAPVASQQSQTSAQAEEQRLFEGSLFPAATNEQLHAHMLAARNGLLLRCADTHNYVTQVVVPACEAIILRFKMPGVAAKHRPNGQPTVEAYFKSIDLKYTTVRSWFHRKKAYTELFDPAKPKPLTQLEATSLELVKVIREGGNVDEATTAVEDVRALQDFCPDLDRPTEKELPSLALRLVCEIESFFNDPEAPSMPENLKAIVDRLNSALPSFVLNPEQQAAF